MVETEVRPWCLKDKTYGGARCSRGWVAGRHSPWPVVRNQADRPRPPGRDLPRWGKVCSSPPCSGCAGAQGLPQQAIEASHGAGGSDVRPADILLHGEQLPGASPLEGRRRPAGVGPAILRRKRLPGGSHFRLRGEAQLQPRRPRKMESPQ